MSEETNPNIVQIHLNFTQSNEQLHVDFQYDTDKDDLDSVVNDLISTLGCSQEQTPMLKDLISKQIKDAIAKAQDDDSSSENMSGNEYNQNSAHESRQNSTANLNGNPKSGATTSQIDADDGNSDEILNDPEYIQLLQKQEKEMNDLKARHRAEQQALERKLTSGTADDDLLIF